ncbi:MAG: NAD(P)/FAD-dependent oxidoreductase [Pseudomonadota bacterium]
MSGNYDTIIVGGGLTGLISARELSRAGQNVALLEGKDRLGGRAWTADLGGDAIELGGGYVYWSQPHIWSEITRYGLSLIERPYYTSTNAMRQTRFLIEGALQAAFSTEQAAEIKAAFDAYVAPASEVFPQPFAPFTSDAYRAYDHLSARDRIDQLELSPLARATLLRTSGMQCNNAPEHGAYIEALRWFALANCDPDTYAASVSRFTLAEGTQGLLDAIAADTTADITLGAEVTKIETTQDGVIVRTEQGSVTARACIVATGVNVWRRIAFSPGLSVQKSALTAEGLSGQGAKIYVRIRGRFEDSRWSAVGGAILSVLPHLVGDDSSVLVVFTNPAHPMEEVTLQRLQAEIARFDESLEVLDFTWHDWNSDPFVRGTWGNFRPGQFAKYFADALTPEGPVYFAGSDIALGWRGFFDGAIESGTRTARAVLAHGGQACSL